MQYSLDKGENFLALGLKTRLLNEVTKVNTLPAKDFGCFYPAHFGQISDKMFGQFAEHSLSVFTSANTN